MVGFLHSSIYDLNMYGPVRFVYVSVVCVFVVLCPLSGPTLFSPAHAVTRNNHVCSIVCMQSNVCWCVASRGLLRGVGNVRAVCGGLNDESCNWLRCKLSVA